MVDFALMKFKRRPKQHFELLSLRDEITQEQWALLGSSILRYSGLFSRFDVTFSCKGNVLRYFLSSKRDLSVLSNNLDGLLLRPLPVNTVQIPAHQTREHWIRFVTTGNLLDVREKYSIRRGKDLSLAVFKVRRTGKKSSWVKTQLHFRGLGGKWSRSSKVISDFGALPAQLLAINFKENVRYLKKSVKPYLDIEKSLHLLTSNRQSALFVVDTFPYFSRSYYLGLNRYEFDKHSLIIGATGTGKSKLISLMIDRLEQTFLSSQYRVVVIDPHASIADDLAHISSSRVISFQKEGTDLFAESTADVMAATELTATLFKALLADQFNARLQRVLRFSLFVLLTAQSMSMDMLKRFLTDLELRTQVLNHVGSFVPQNIIQFFGSDFNEIRTTQYTEAILPIVSMIDELQLQPVLSRADISLERTIRDNFLTVFSLNKVSMGEKATKTIAGLLIQQIFLMAQARVFNQKVILIIDEVSVVQNPTIASILAEARKFNLSVILTQQYFGQIAPELRAAIFSNVYNYYVFKASEEDARALEGNLNIEIPKEVLAAAQERGHSETEVRVKLITELNPRECLVRLSSRGHVTPCLRVRTLDAADPGKSRSRLTHNPHDLPPKFVEHEAVFVPMSRPDEIRNEKVTQPQPHRGLSLSEVLADQSSSRSWSKKDK